MKITSVLILITLAVSATSAVARIGENRQGIEKRYGEGKRSDIQRLDGAETMKYHFNDFEIEVVFHDDKSIWEIFHLGRYINYSDIKPLLKANAGSGHTWRYDGMNHRWERSGDPKYIAYRWPGHEDYFCIEDVKACEAFWNGETSELRGF